MSSCIARKLRVPPTTAGARFYTGKFLKRTFMQQGPNYLIGPLAPSTELPDGFPSTRPALHTRVSGNYREESMGAWFGAIQGVG